MGTPGFASPEQFRRSQSDGRSDIFSLGALMHYLLTLQDPGLRPFDFEPPSLANSAVSNLMEKIMQKALEIKPENRFLGALEMKKVLSGELSIDDLPGRGFIIISPQELHFLNMRPGKEKAAEITVRNSRDLEMVRAHLTSAHPGLIAEPSSIDAPSATINVRPDHRRFRRGEKTETSLTLSTESSKVSIPVTVHYQPSFLRRLSPAWYGLAGLIIPLVIFSCYVGDIQSLAKDYPIDTFFVVLLYAIIVGGLAFLPTIRKKDLKPLALAGNIFLILLPFLFVYLYLYKLPFIAFDDQENIEAMSSSKIRSLCHRVLLWGPRWEALEPLASEGDSSSLPYIIWAKGMDHDNRNAPRSSTCSGVLQRISNQNAGDSRREMLEWYWKNWHRSITEWWIEGFNREGCLVSMENTSDSIDNLLTMLGQRRGFPRDWLIFNGCRMLDHFNSRDVAEKVNKALDSGKSEQKTGAERYCACT